ncbi:hypothetical protein B296_00028063 [Ensete ventricosum]|uniref:15-cis-phytoene synthase n=1 Tax=Ensete ventricosum TaxID=4639 RepID=A0A427A2D9_ENSVE|nr:hypothetical protein B296_00028063 [Ensete ventricosum]
MIHQPLFSLHAFVQLTGDLSISARGGRIYLPQDELAWFGLSDDDIFTGKVTDKWRSFMKNQIRRARMFFRTAEDGVTELDQASRSTCFFDFVTILDEIIHEARFCEQRKEADGSNSRYGFPIKRGNLVERNHLSINK